MVAWHVFIKDTLAVAVAESLVLAVDKVRQVPKPQVSCADSSGALSSPCTHHASATLIKITPFADTGYKAYPSNGKILDGL